MGFHDSLHIDSAIESLQHLSGVHAYSIAYDNETDRNHVDGLLDHAFNHVMKAQTFDERQDYKSAHSALTTGTNSAMKAIDVMHANSSTVDLSGHRLTLEGAPRGYHQEAFL
jgi:hypothetical protein